MASIYLEVTHSRKETIPNYQIRSYTTLWSVQASSILFSTQLTLRPRALLPTHHYGRTSIKPTRPGAWALIGRG